MRKLLLFFFGASMFAACDSSTPNSEIAADKTDSPSAKIDYPYTLKVEPDWERGDYKNVAIILNGLKAWETRNFDKLKDYFADSIEFNGDQFHFKGSSDSLISMFKKDAANVGSVRIEMNDWEAVHGKHNNEDWVSIWYKEFLTDKSGKVDSTYYMDDARIVNGKIVSIDSKMRRYPKK